MLPNKDKAADALQCSCGRSFRTIGALTDHCQCKGHSLVLVAQFHKGSTVVNNYVFHNTPVEVHASEHGYSIRRLDGGNQAQSANAPEGGVSSFRAVDNVLRPDNVPQGVQLERAEREVKKESPPLSLPSLPPTSSNPNPRVYRARQTRPRHANASHKPWSCLVCQKKFFHAQDCYRHCMAMHHRCCPHVPVHSLRKFREHLFKEHGQNEEPLLLKYEDQDTQWRTRAKTRSQTKAAYRQQVAQNSQAASTIPPGPSSFPADPPSSATLRQEAPIPRENPCSSSKTAALASGGKTATSQYRRPSNPTPQFGTVVEKESKTPSLTEGTLQGTSATGNRKTEKGDERVGTQAQSTTNPPPVSVASIWRGLDVSKLRGKGSYIEKDEEDG